MRSAFVLISLCLLASSAFGTKETMMNQLTRFSSNQFGKTIIETIEVQMMTSEDPRPILIQFLEDLRDANRQAQSDADENIAYARSYCTDATSGLEDLIASTQTALDTDKADLKATRPLLKAKEDEIAIERATLGNFEFQLEEATKSREANFVLYTEKSDRYAKILAVLREVRSQIHNRASTRYESGSFLQKNGATFMAQIKEKVSALGDIKGWGRMINFLASKVETNMRQNPDEAADTGLAAILRVIDDLIRRFSEEQGQNEAWNAEDLAAYNKLSGELQGKILQLRLIISGLDQLIQSLTSKIAELESNIATYEETIRSKNDELNLIRESCDTTERDYQASTATRTEELGIIEEVLRIIKEELHGRRQVTEDAINRTEIPDWEDEETPEGYNGLADLLDG